MTIEEPRSIGDLDETTSFRMLSRLSERSGIQEQLAKATLVADLGSGLGSSTVVLTKLCPKSQIHTIDMVHDELGGSVETRITENHTHYPTDIHSYLELLTNEGKKLDAALLCGVPDHQLDKDNGYSLLAEVISENGLVIELRDTNLNDNLMNKYFSSVLCELNNSYNHRHIWKKLHK